MRPKAAAPKNVVPAGAHPELLEGAAVLGAMALSSSQAIFYPNNRRRRVFPKGCRTGILPPLRGLIPFIAGNPGFRPALRDSTRGYYLPRLPALGMQFPVSVAFSHNNPGGAGQSKRHCGEGASRRIAELPGIHKLCSRFLGTA